MANRIKNAVVTGGASGLGRALCIELAKQGANVVISDIDETGSQETKKRLDALGAKSLVVPCDVREFENVQALQERAEAEWGPIDFVANNAGVAVGGSFCDISLEDWRWAMDINLWGVIYGCRAFIPSMKKHGRGCVLNVASAAGLVASPQLSPYNVTKSAVVALTETLFAELSSHGVNATVLCPTFFETEIGRSSRGPINPKLSELVDKRMKQSDLQANDVARIAIDHVRKGELYAVPMRDGRMMWRAKRASPMKFQQALASGGFNKVLQWLGNR